MSVDKIVKIDMRARVYVCGKLESVKIRDENTGSDSSLDKIWLV